MKINLAILVTAWVTAQGVSAGYSGEGITGMAAPSPRYIEEHPEVARGIKAAGERADYSGLPKTPRNLEAYPELTRRSEKKTGTVAKIHPAWAASPRGREEIRGIGRIELDANLPVCTCIARK